MAEWDMNHDDESYTAYEAFTEDRAAEARAARAADATYAEDELLDIAGRDDHAVRTFDGKEYRYRRIDKLEDYAHLDAMATPAPKARHYTAETDHGQVLVSVHPNGAVVVSTRRESSDVWSPPAFGKVVS